MINQSQSLMVLNQSCNQAVQWTVGQLRQCGLQVLQTFDFEVARGMETSCDCVYHGTDRCDCQVVFLLVYGKASQPVSLVAHGCDGKTWINLVESFQANNPSLEAQIRRILVFSAAGGENQEESVA